jgi:hypothetical protein
LWDLELDPLNGPVAVLYQAVRPPLARGIPKPMKSCGYSERDADIACAFRAAGVPSLTPLANPHIVTDLDWVFPDHACGIREAINRGARVLWANTVLFSRRPIEDVLNRLSVVGQHPDQVQLFDDKWETNNMLRARGLPVARYLLVGRSQVGLTRTRSPKTSLRSGDFHFRWCCSPARERKPRRGSRAEFEMNCVMLPARCCRLLQRTVTNSILLRLLADAGGVPAWRRVDRNGDAVRQMFKDHWALPPVRRFNYHDGVAPYNGVVAVAYNSAALAAESVSKPEVQSALKACAQAQG